MLGFIKDKAQKAKALVGEAVEASATAIVKADSPAPGRGGARANLVGRGNGSGSAEHNDQSQKGIKRYSSNASQRGARCPRGR